MKIVKRLPYSHSPDEGSEEAEQQPWTIHIPPTPEPSAPDDDLEEQTGETSEAAHPLKPSDADDPTFVQPRRPTAAPKEPRATFRGLREPDPNEPWTIHIRPKPED